MFFAILRNKASSLPLLTYSYDFDQLSKTLAKQPTAERYSRTNCNSDICSSWTTGYRSSSSCRTYSASFLTLSVK